WWYALSLRDALPICGSSESVTGCIGWSGFATFVTRFPGCTAARSGFFAARLLAQRFDHLLPLLIIGTLEPGPPGAQSIQRLASGFAHQQKIIGGAEPRVLQQAQCPQTLTLG